MTSQPLVPRGSITGALTIQEAFEVVVRRMTPDVEYTLTQVLDGVWHVLIAAPANLTKDLSIIEHDIEEALREGRLEYNKEGVEFNYATLKKLRT